MLVDDQLTVREGVALVINAEPDLKVCAQAGNSRQAMEAVKKSKPDVVIVDISLQGQSGFSLIRTIRKSAPRLPVMVLSMYNESYYAEQSLQAGAAGYVMKQETSAQLLECIRRVLGGEIYISNRVTANLVQRSSDRSFIGNASPHERLSRREREVFELIGQGLGATDVAGRLDLSVKTVEFHQENLKRKLNMETSTHLRRTAIAWSRVAAMRPEE